MKFRFLITNATILENRVGVHGRILEGTIPLWFSGNAFVVDEPDRKVFIESRAFVSRSMVDSDIYFLFLAMPSFDPVIIVDKIIEGEVDIDKLFSIKTSGLLKKFKRNPIAE